MSMEESQKTYSLGLQKIKYSILITTKDRLDDLLYTISKIKHLIERDDTECIICDDGSADGTHETIKRDFPEIQLLRNESSRGLIYSRNRLLNLTSADYAISLDDDANFLTENVLEKIENHFVENPACGMLALRIFWGSELPPSTNTKTLPVRVSGFVGCGHVWRMEAWKNIPDYPDWFIFYGEEDFAAYQLLKHKWEIHYTPEILVHHRVDLLFRKKNADYQLRQRRALRAGWYLYFMFYPWKAIPRKLAYTFSMQIKNKVLKGDVKASLAIVQAIGDVIINLPRLLKQSNRLTDKELNDFSKLPKTKVYWKPDDEK